MSEEWVPKAGTVKVGGLSRAAQKLQAAREKAAQQTSGDKHTSKAALNAVKAKSSFAGKKTNFQRKAV